MLKCSILLSLCLLLSDCGLNRGVSQRFDQPPSGTIIFQGSFAANSNSISGIVQIYNSSGTLVVRLNGFSSPSSNYYLFLETSGNNQLYVTQLQAQQGSINYFTGINVVTVNQLTIRDTTNVMSPTLAAAVLSVP